MTLWRFVATFFYLGRLPFAPGSWGSLGALLLWFFLPITFSVHLSFLIILFVLGVYSSNKMAKYLDLEVTNPYVEIFTIKENDKFIAKEASIFEEEKNVANKAPVELIDVNDLSISCNNRMMLIYKKGL